MDYSGLIEAAPQFALGLYQSISANRELKRLQRQGIPQYNITPEQIESYNRASEMSRTGLTAAERAVAEQGITRNLNAGYRRALDLGGGATGRGILGALSAQGLTARNDLAAMDAGLRRRNIQYADQVGRGITDQRNRETTRAYNYRMLLEQNLGLAKKVGLENIVNSMAYANNGEGLNLNWNWNRNNGGTPNTYNQEPIPQGYTQPNNPYQGGFNLPPSGNYTWPQ